MGYDMYYRDRVDQDGEGYFRLNIFGMARFGVEMAAQGMTFSAGPHPDWPEYPADFDPDAIRYPEDYPDEKLTDEQTARAHAYLAAHDAVLSWHGPETPGIPEHKFWSNDGWIVTPAECEAAARIARDDPFDDELTSRWSEWIAFIRRAARHGGFGVY